MIDPDFSKLGSLGGKKSPTNFKNNPKAASEAGKRSKGGGRPGTHECGFCHEMMGAKRLNAHLIYKEVDGEVKAVSCKNLKGQR